MSRADELPSFDAWATDAEPQLRKALAGAVSSDTITDAVGAALLHAWSRWSRMSALLDVRGDLYRIGLAEVPPSERIQLPLPGPTEIPEVAPALIAALLDLPDRHRTAVWLVHGCKWTVPQAGDALELSPLMVSSHMGVAMNALQQANPGISPTGDPWPDPATQVAAIAEATLHRSPVAQWPTDLPKSASRLQSRIPLVLLAVVVVVAALIGPNLTNRARLDPESASTSVSPSTDAPGPIGSTPGSPLDGEALESTDPAMSTTPIPIAPLKVAQRFVGDTQIIGDRLVVVDSNEVWLSSDRAASWQRLAFPEGATYDSYSSCYSAIDDRIVISTVGSGSRKLFVEDRDRQSWDVVTVPAAPERANWYWGNRLCRPIEVNGAWVLATTERDGLRIASTGDRGDSFVQHQILFPPDWLALGTDFGLGGFVNLFIDGDWIVGQVCVSREASACPSQEVAIHKSVIAGSPQAEIAWDLTDADGQPLIVWDDNRLTYTNEIELFQFDDAVWRTEITQALGDDDPAPIGTWASGPFAGPLAPLPSRPSLFPREGGAVACVEDGSQCWMRDHDDVEWTRLDESPIVAWETLPSGTRVTFSELTADGSVLVVPFSALQ